MLFDTSMFYQDLYSTTNKGKIIVCGAICIETYCISCKVSFSCGIRLTVYIDVIAFVFSHFISLFRKQHNRKITKIQGDNNVVQKVNKLQLTTTMAEPGVFDELSSRMSQGKRPDSGIHNSVELNVDESEQKVKRANADELADSGQESADQMDSSTNTASTKKKEGFFKSFKKIFKKKKTKKKTDESTGIQEQYKARSETDVLSTPNNDEPANKFQRLHSDASSLSPKRSKPLLNDLIGTKDEDDDEQKVGRRLTFLNYHFG